MLYELASKAEGSGYRWTLWSATPRAGFRLFAHGPGANHLAWVDGPTVVFAEVSRSIDRQTAMQLRVAGKEHEVRVRLPLRQLVPQVMTWGVDAFNADIRVEDVARGEGGEWTVKIAGPDSDQVYTIVGDGEKWTLK